MWSPIHLRTKLKELYWKDGQVAVKAAAFFEDTLRYLYMPRLRNRGVLEQAIQAGARSQDFFGTAYGQSGQKFEGFQFGEGNIILDDALLLIEPETAKAYEEANRPAPKPSVPEGPYDGDGSPILVQPVPQKPVVVLAAPSASAKSFHLTAEVPATTAKMRLVQLADEIVSALCSDPNASVRVVVEISAEFPDGVSDTVKRAVSENTKSLGLQAPDWE